MASCECIKILLINNYFPLDYQLKQDIDILILNYIHKLVINNVC